MTSYNPAEHTIDEVRRHLKRHPEDAQAVLAAEQARGDEARVTLVNALSGNQADDSGEMTYEDTLAAQGQQRQGWTPQAGPSQKFPVDSPR